MSAIKATRYISLYCTCPECSEYAALLASQDFWEANLGILPIENGTPRTTDMEVVWLIRSIDHDPL